MNTLVKLLLSVKEEMQCMYFLWRDQNANAIMFMITGQQWTFVSSYVCITTGADILYVPASRLSAWLQPRGRRSFNKQKLFNKSLNACFHVRVDILLTDMITVSEICSLLEMCARASLITRVWFFFLVLPLSESFKERERDGNNWVRQRGMTHQLRCSEAPGGQLFTEMLSVYVFWI